MRRFIQSKKLDYSLALLLTIFMLLSAYFVWAVRSLPSKWKLAMLAIFALVYLLLVALTFKKMNGKKRWFRRGMIVFVTIVYGFVSFYAYKGNSAIKQITNTDKEKYVSIHVIVKKDSSIEDISALSTKTVGLQSGLDEENSSYAQSELNKEVKKVNYKSEESYITLMQELENNEIDAMIISNSFLQNIEAENEGYSDSVNIIATYKRKVENKTSSANTKDLTKEPFTVLISGLDTSDGGEASGRSDTIMLLIVNPLTNHVEMVSFLRDSYVPNIALGGGYDKLTHTSNNGVENTLESLQSIIGFDIDFYVQVNFTSLVEIVDTIGGIEVDVPMTFWEQNSARENGEGSVIEIQKGLQTLNGEQALAYARNRKDQPDGDIGRTRAQQDIVVAMIQRMLTPQGALKAPALLDIIPKYVDTNVSYQQLSDFINSELETLSPWTFGSTSLDNGTFDMLTTVYESMGNLSCYVLSISDMETLYHKYQMITNPTNFNKFSFDLEDLNATLPQYVRPAIGVFAEDYLGDYKGDTDANYDPTYYEDPVIELPVQEEEEVEQTEPETTTPVEPETPKPTDPEVPEEETTTNTTTGS